MVGHGHGIVQEVEQEMMHLVVQPNIHVVMEQQIVVMVKHVMTEIQTIMMDVVLYVKLKCLWKSVGLLTR